MKANEMSWKARINRYAKEHGIAPQVVLQNIMFERFLRRLSKSSHRNHFVLKGGVLVAAIVGLDYRSTMDIDTTLRSFPLTEETLTNAMQEISAIDEQDGTSFQLLRIETIRQDDVYGGLRLYMQAVSGSIGVPFSIDVSTGDAITPQPIETEIPSFFEGLPPVQVWSYNIETILAEKLETILRRGVLSTRPRDFYDVYALSRTREINLPLLREALQATANHRQSEENLTNWQSILQGLSTSSIQQNHWNAYRRKYPYAKEIEYNELMSALRHILSSIR